jgi:hypothetical protein
MSPFTLALLTTAVPMFLWRSTLSKARSLAKARAPTAVNPDAPGRRVTRIAIYFLAYWPFLLLPVLLPYGLYRLIQADLPTASLLNLALAVGTPILFTLVFVTAISDGSDERTGLLAFLQRHAIPVTGLPLLSFAIYRLI